MDAPTLGPAGVLPPVGWMTGAHLQDTDIDGLRYIVLGTIGTDADADPLMAATVGAFGCQMARVKRWRTALLLDGPLDFATRALLALVAPDVEQPDCAPSWSRCSETWIWQLVAPATDWIPSDAEMGPEGEWAEREWFFGFASDAADYVDAVRQVDGISDEDCPRRALALALHAAAGVTP
jgi:hypothetical protein